MGDQIEPHDTIADCQLPIANFVLPVNSGCILEPTVRAAAQSAIGNRQSTMSELDEAWAMALAEAEQRARTAGRRELAEYLALRNSNDLLRQTAITWLMETFVGLAADANRAGSSIQFTRDDKHRFKAGNSTMVGRLLTLRDGVRTLFVEAGWPRVPSDGFVSGGGLARGNIRHYGIKSADVELLLVRSKKGAPEWMMIDAHGKQHKLHESSARKQLTILLNSPSEL
jgi:hypothetical protein